MIDPRELRRGNIIHAVIKYIVTGIDEEVITAIPLDKNMPQLKTKDSIDKFEPIPLTEEWLVKFGFRNTAIKWNDGSVSESVWQMKTKYSIEFTSEGIAFFLFFGQMGNPVFLDHVPYIHSLQNLYFALTGEELTIEQYDTI